MRMVRFVLFKIHDNYISLRVEQLLNAHLDLGNCHNKRLSVLVSRWSWNINKVVLFLIAYQNETLGSVSIERTSEHNLLHYSYVI